MNKLLIVEDETGVADMLKITLQQAGYKVLTAANGKEGLEKAFTNQPDLIITDVLMPVMDGFVFLKELKKNKLTATLPVIVLTARGQMEDTFDVYGADAFLEKFAGDSIDETKRNYEAYLRQLQAY